MLAQQDLLTIRADREVYYYGCEAIQIQREVFAAFREAESVGFSCNQKGLQAFNIHRKRSSQFNPWISLVTTEISTLQLIDQELFRRHPDIVKRLCSSAPTLLETLLDGFIWRSRLSVHGMRRVNYYIKYLIQDRHGTDLVTPAQPASSNFRQDLEGNFSQAISCFVEHGDPKLLDFEWGSFFELLVSADLWRCLNLDLQQFVSM